MMLYVAIAAGLVAMSAVVRIIRFAVLTVGVVLVMAAATGHGSAMFAHLAHLL